MTRLSINRLRALLLAGCASLSFAPGLASAQAAKDHFAFDIPAQDLDGALTKFGRQSEREIVVSAELTHNRRAPGVHGDLTPEQALGVLLADTGLRYRTTASGSIVVEAADPQGESAGGGADTNVVQELVVTAQKKEEAIQTVPIAISAFTQKSLEEQHIEGGFDLLKAIPNVTFSKNNFTGYNFSIRGIGTKAISVTTDPGVAVSFNSTTLIRNRLFEQEYFDVERVEVLRGPQGTLYGRNATSGVINVISAKPNLEEFSGMGKGEVGNYNTKRLSATVNVPLIKDKLAIRIAGAQTSRNGYGVDLYDNSHVDGRDLWSGRATISFKPTNNFRADLIWERFNENDDRARTSKQLCTRDQGLDQVGGVALVPIDQENGTLNRAGLSQGCLPGSLYDDKAYGTPNGAALPFILYMQTYSIGRDYDHPAGCQLGGFRCPVVAYDSDPYGNTTQSRDLRAIYSQIKPHYRANADVFELNMSWNVTQSLTLTSQTAYDKDSVYSTQDFNRYTTLPVFVDSSTKTDFFHNPSKFATMTPGGVFCDPQLGCSNTIVGMDLSRARSRQFSQEFRLQSDWEGRFNFNAGLTYTRYQTTEDYYIFFNALNMLAMELNSGSFPIGGQGPSKPTLNPDCSIPSDGAPDGLICIPIESNPIKDIQDTGHNYFRSRNPYKLNSWGAFGEAYWKFSDALKLTVGLRYTDDKKIFTPIPSELFLSDPARLAATIPSLPFVEGFYSGAPIFSFASGAYPAQPDIERSWGELTGRAGLDWKPQLSFTEQTMVYGFYSRGYKGGGMNPPRIGLNYDALAAHGTILAPSAPAEFRPEFVNALEVGAKNTLLGGSLVLNGDVFFYDYKDYQVSKIVDRTANNENFDAKVWGLELESVFQPIRNLRINASLGYLDTKLGQGSKSIDVMNRTAGHTDFVVLKPAIVLTSNCIAPAHIVGELVALQQGGNVTTVGATAALCPGGNGFGTDWSGRTPLDLTLPDGTTYNPADHPEYNYGAGFYSDVSGHELPNSPHWTMTLGAEYSREVLENWKVTLRADAYWQSQSWARIYELPIDKLHGWYNANLSLWIERPESGLKFEIYAKNVLNKSPITDTFTNSDDTDLTTNVFVLDPRLIGVSITKTF